MLEKDNLELWEEDIKRINYTYLSLLRSFAMHPELKKMATIIFGVSPQFIEFINTVSMERLLELVDKNILLVNLRLPERTVKQLVNFLNEQETLENMLIQKRTSNFEQMQKIKQKIVKLKKILENMSLDREAHNEFNFCLEKYKKIVTAYAKTKKRIKKEIENIRYQTKIISLQAILETKHRH